MQTDSNTASCTALSYGAAQSTPPVAIIYIVLSFGFLAQMFFFTPGAQAELSTKWSEGEHLELGDSAAALACHELSSEFVSEFTACPSMATHRQDRRVKFSYGELLMAVDYYNTPEELFQDSEAGIKLIVKCANHLRADYPYHPDGAPKYSDCTVLGPFFINGFLEIVSKNYDHFAWHNMKAYVHYHEKALDFARQSYLLKQSDPDQSQLLLEKALLNNAFADHYLSDAFAAGHLRLPRTQLKAWAKKNLHGFFKSLRGDLLAIFLHENEEHDFRSNKNTGLKVMNSRGDLWTTRGDQYLKVDLNPKDPVFILPQEAIKESVKEILTARLTGKTPQGLYQATLLTPFPDDVSLKTKFTEDYLQTPLNKAVKALYKELPFYYRIFMPKSDIYEMIDALDVIYQKFHQDVHTDLRADPRLQRRLPAPYINAFLNVS